MADDTGKASSEMDPEFRSIMDAIDDIAELAKLNPVSASIALSFGYLNPELERKLITLGDKLDHFSRRKIG